MPSENHLAQPLQSDTQVSGDVKGSTFSDHGNNDTSQAPKGGMAGYVVSSGTNNTGIEFTVDLVQARLSVYRSRRLDSEYHCICCSHRCRDITATHVGRLVPSDETNTNCFPRDLVFGKLVLCSAAVSRASLTRQICFYIYRVFYW
jgi:hypothetical protein